MVRRPSRDVVHVVFPGPDGQPRPLRSGTVVAVAGADRDQYAGHDATAAITHLITSIGEDVWRAVDARDATFTCRVPFGGSEHGVMVSFGFGSRKGPQYVCEVYTEPGRLWNMSVRVVKQRRRGDGVVVFAETFPWVRMFRDRDWLRRMVAGLPVVTGTHVGPLPGNGVEARLKYDRRRLVRK